MTASIPQQAARHPRSRGELVVDVLLVVGIAAYLLVAHSYPPIGREIPTVVGVVGLIAAVVQLIGWFVPGLWNLTHGQAGSEHAARPAGAAAAPVPVAEAAVTATAVPAAAADTAATEAAVADPGTPDAETAGPRARDVLVVMGWAAGFVTAVLVLGYDIAVPLFFLAYFGSRRQWKLAVASAVVMGLVTHFLFETALGIPLPGGVLF